MCGFNKKLFLIAACLWICGYQKVEAENDALELLSPVKDVILHRRPRSTVSSNEELPCDRPNVYVCEEVPDPVPSEAQKTCNYRNQRYHEQIYRWVAGRGCLLYTPDFLFVDGINSINLNAGCFYGDWFAPCLEIAKEDGTCACYPFDPGLEEVATRVRNALISSAHGRWERCFYAAGDCCSHHMLPNTNYTDPNTCEATFDGWTCWQSAPAGARAAEICSEFAYSGQGPSCHHYSSKQCYNNGSWEIQTDYSSCSITPRLLSRYRYYIAVLAFSIVFCLPAVFVFLFYKRLRNNARVTLHRNLLIAIILRNIFVIISRREIYIDELTNPGETVMTSHSILCRVLAVAERAAANAVFVCMLIEGIYLHRLIVAIFRQKINMKILYGTCAVITIAPLVAWSWVMAVYDDHSCWLVYTMDNVQWILDGPRIAILLINTALFFDVLRVLLTKVRNSENVNQLNTAKATLFLMPIFGVQFLLTAFRPSTTNCLGEQIYYYVSYTVEGLQGFIVALLYCYVNKEVHMLVKATYKKTENAVVSRVRRDSTFPRMSLGSNSDKKITYTTELQPHIEEYAAIRPKIHVAEIISIQTSERLAEILEPIYESIRHGIINESYDSLERSDVDNDSGFTPNRQQDEYYGFTNASSVSVDCQYWLRRTSNSSIYNRSTNLNEANCIGKIPSNKTNEMQVQERIPEYKNIGNDNERSRFTDPPERPPSLSLYEDCDSMFREIMLLAEKKKSNKTIVLDPSRLATNKNEDDDVTCV